MAVLEVAKEIKFIYQILKSIGVEIELPIVVKMDNVGAKFMTENVTTSQRTKHVDIRYNYVWEFIQDGFIKIIFVKLEDNKADIFTKNVTLDLLKKHNTSFIHDIQENG